MDPPIPDFKLNTGVAIPAIGLGTWQSAAGEVQDAVFHALKSGYRHIDAALVYGNENEVGAGIRQALKAGITRREDVFVTSKLWSTHHRDPMAGLDESLKRLGLDYLDLYLVHWPVAMNAQGSHPLFPTLPDGSRDIDHARRHIDTYKAMETLLSTGKTKAIGVCNYSVPFLKELLAEAQTVPAVNQIENHPLLPQQEIVDFCNANGIRIQAFSPLGSSGSPLLADKTVRQIAGKHNVRPSTVLISYQVKRGHVVLSKSVTPARIEQNLKVVLLDDGDMAALEDVHKQEGIHRYVYPAFGVPLGFPDKS